MGGNWHPTTNYAEKLSCHLLHLSISTKSLWYVCIYSSGYIYFIIGYCCQYHQWNFRRHPIHSNSMKSSVRNRLFLLELLASEVPKTPKCSNALGDAPELMVRLLLRTSHMWLRALRYQAGTHLSLPPYCLTFIMFEGAMHTITNPTHHHLLQGTGFRGECTTASVLDGHCSKLSPN